MRILYYKVIASLFSLVVFCMTECSQIVLMKAAAHKYSELAFEHKKKYKYELINIAQDIEIFISASQVSMYSLLWVDSIKGKASAQTLGEHIAKDLYGFSLIRLISGGVMMLVPFVMLKKLLT